jgi:hypothetical protein
VIGRIFWSKGEQTEGDEDDHPDADVNLATTIPVLENSTSGIDVIGGNDEILHEVIVPKRKSNGGVHETGSITGKATLVWNVGRHFAEGNHDKVTDKADEAVPE